MSGWLLKNFVHFSDPFNSSCHSVCEPYPCRKTWSRFSHSLWHWRSLFRRIRGLLTAVVWFLKNTAACICNSHNKCYYFLSKLIQFSQLATRREKYKVLTQSLAHNDDQPPSSKTPVNLLSWTNCSQGRAARHKQGLVMVCLVTPPPFHSYTDCSR